MATVKLKGKLARGFMAAQMVDAHGESATDKTTGPMKESVQEVIDVRMSSRGTHIDLRDVVGKVTSH